DLGGTKTQVGLLFSVMTIVSMFLRPTVGGWVDRFGARPVIVPGIAALALTSLALQLATTPVAIIVLLVGLGFANGLLTTPAGVVRRPALHRRPQVGVRVRAALCGGAGSDGGPRLVLRRLSGVADPVARAAARRVGPPGTPAREPVCHVGGRARLLDHRAAAD